MSEMSASDWAAWWGAITASVVLGWDIYKWRKSKSDIRVSASPNMQTLKGGHLENDKNIFVEVANNGDKTTTLTHLVVKHYKNLFDLLRRKPSMQGLVPNPVGNPLPYELAPGKRWTGLIDQKDLEEKSAGLRYLYCGVHHTASKKAKMVRVKFG